MNLREVVPASDMGNDRADVEYSDISLGIVDSGGGIVINEKSSDIARPAKMYYC